MATTKNKYISYTFNALISICFFYKPREMRGSGSSGEGIIIVLHSVMSFSTTLGFRNHCPRTTVLQKTGLAKWRSTGLLVQFMETDLNRWRRDSKVAPTATLPVSFSMDTHLFFLSLAYKNFKPFLYATQKQINSFCLLVTRYFPPSCFLPSI